VADRFHVSLRSLFVVVCSVAWIGFVLWLTVPWIDDMGHTISVPAAVALVVCLWLIPGVLNVRLLSLLLFDDRDGFDEGSEQLPRWHA
jgi:hypothetical protein